MRSIREYEINIDKYTLSIVYYLSAGEIDCVCIKHNGRRVSTSDKRRLWDELKNKAIDIMFSQEVK